MHENKQSYCTGQQLGFRSNQGYSYTSIPGTHVWLSVFCYWHIHTDSCEGACASGGGIGSYDSNELGDDDLPMNRAKFNAYLKISNLQYSETFQKREKKEKYATDLENCLADFTNLDVLDEDNKFICQNCSISRYSHKAAINSMNNYWLFVCLSPDCK